ncbi:MAG: Bug family tripartite tricarboxylate transporter substrate binding protein [Burkholderiales bacterium]
MKILTAAFQISTLGVLIALGNPADAQQAYPSKPIRIIVPFPPGASNDILARIVGKKLTDAFGVQTIVDNRAGASTIIGASALLKSAPDGYTIMVTSGTHLITPLLMPAPYDAVKDFTPVATLDRSDYLLVVHPLLPANTLKEFIALAKTRPGQINYASSANGSGNHLSAELLALRTGIKMQHVPYKGGGPAVVDLMAGQVQMFFNSPSSTLPYVQRGKLKALAMTGDVRFPALPNVPTFAESGVPNFDVKSWHAILAPPATPKAIVDSLAAEAAKILAMPDTIERLQSLGLSPFVSTPEQLAALMRAETIKYAGVIKAANIKSD